MCVAVIAIIFSVANVSLNFIFLVGSTLIVSAVPPISFAILWDKCSKAAAITGAPMTHPSSHDTHLLLSPMLCKNMSLDASLSM